MRRIAAIDTHIARLDSIDAGDDWTGALCRETDPDLWFPEPGKGKPPDWETPRAICRRCPLRDRCLEYAMDREGQLRGEYRYGMYGSLDPYERAALARKRAKG